MNEQDNRNELDGISTKQILSEEFIREFQDKIDWRMISCSQKLSIKFIIEFYKRIDFQALLRNENISDEVKEFCRIFL